MPFFDLTTFFGTKGFFGIKKYIENHTDMTIA